MLCAVVLLPLSRSHLPHVCEYADAVLSSCYTLCRCSPSAAATAVEECKQRNESRFCKCTELCRPQQIHGLQLAAPTSHPDREARIASGEEATQRPFCKMGPAQPRRPYVQTKGHYLRTMLWYGTMNVLSSYVPSCVGM